MSNVKNTGFRKMKCGDQHHSEKMIRDTGGGYVDFQIVGTDVNVSGVKTGASITVGTGDYSPGNGANGDPCKNPDGTFFIIPETDGIFFVTLFDGSDFIITSVQSAAYLGQPWPGKIRSVNVGTTGNFSVGY
jgi:hypothetical protein